MVVNETFKNNLKSMISKNIWERVTQMKIISLKYFAKYTLVREVSFKYKESKKLN